MEKSGRISSNLYGYVKENADNWQKEFPYNRAWNLKFKRNKRSVSIAQLSR